MSKRHTALWTMVLLSGLATAVGAEDAFYEIPLTELKLTEGQLPPPATQPMNWRMRANHPRPAYAVLSAPGEAYVGVAEQAPTRLDENIEEGNGQFYRRQILAIRAPAGQDLSGRLYLLDPSGPGMTALRFAVPASAAKESARTRFYTVKRAHYLNLAGASVPGTAWFQHQVRETNRALTGGRDDDNLNIRRNWNGRNLDDTMDLFTGGRALAENLQLDRDMPAATTKAADERVDVSTLAGITVQPMDWKAALKDAQPQLDPLASAIPADQYAIFFPSFQAATAIADELDRHSVPALGMPRTQGHEERVISFYERQLGLSMSALSRLLGPGVIRSLAVTGSDPYFPTGADVAVIFEPVNPGALQTLLSAQLALAMSKNPQAKMVTGETAGVKYTGACSPDRTLSSYLAIVGPHVVITNSLAQLERLSLTAAPCPDFPSLTTQDDYRYFRLRYPRGEGGESAFLMLSDATIRRWCGPQMRINSSRRTLAQAYLAELQAKNMDRLAKGIAAEADIVADNLPVDLGEVHLTAQGVTSSRYGHLGFLTPLAELNVSQVTREEAERYNRWRIGYQSNWRWAFDPIALRLAVRPAGLSCDLTVTPLIASSDYRELISIARGAKIAPEAGDPHPDLWHIVLAVNAKSEWLQRHSTMALQMLPGLKVEPLAWLGKSVALYVDDDPAWKELLKGLQEHNGEETYARILPRLPLALNFEVKNGLKLAMFMAAVRAFIETSSPGMTLWEVRKHGQQSYLKVGTSDSVRQDSPATDFAVYYATTPQALIVSLNEATLKRALDRYAARHPASAPAGGATEEAAASAPASSPAVALPAVPPWLGEHLCLRSKSSFARDAVALLRPFSDSLHRQLSFANLPILNEWKRRYPDQDPVALHEKFWHVRLTCPGGGKYVWNEAYQTMESTAYGHPGQPQDGPEDLPYLKLYDTWDFGVTFEDQGLRARAELLRQAR